MKQTDKIPVKQLKAVTSILKLNFIIILLLLMVGESVKSQSNILGVDPFINALYSYTPGMDTWILTSTTTLSMSGFTIQNGTSIAYNSQNGMYYVVLKTTASGGRRLATVDPATGVCTLVGNLGDNFSSITFTPTGKLYGITGSSQGAGGAINPRTLYEINPANATKVFRQTLTNGADGQVIAFNPDDGFIYHWSGNSTTVTEKVDTTAFAVTNIPESGDSHREVFGAVYYKSGAFFVADIDFKMFNLSTTGQYTYTGITYNFFRGLAYSSYPRCVYPTVPFISTAPGYVCGSTANITLDSGLLYEATNWQWYSGSCGGTPVGSGTSISVSPSVTTTYYVRGEGGCATSANCANITISVSPPATPGSISGPITVCTTNTATYSVTPVATATSYTWTVPTGVTGMTITSGQGTNSINVNISAGTVIGNITCTASNGCGTSGVSTLAVSKKPPAPGAITGPTSACGITTADYSIASVFGATSYTWTVPAGMTVTSGTGTTSISVNIASTFTQGVVKVMAVNACGSVPGASLTVYGKVAPTSITGSANVCGMSTAVYSTPAIINATSYNWVVPTSWTIAGQGTTSITATLPPNVNNVTFSGAVKVAAVSACGTSAYKSLTVSYCKSPVIIDNGTDDEATTFSSIYPNPASNEFTISMYEVSSTKYQDVVTEVYDVLGNKVIQQKNKIESGETFLKTNIEQLKTGMYFVRLLDGDANVLYTERIIKQ